MEEYRPRNDDDWIFVGSSPYAPVNWPVARRDFPTAKVITTNSGLLIVPAPDVYLLADSAALDRFQEPAEAAQRDLTHVVTIRTEPRFAWCDELFTEYKQRDIILSGMLCLEYAIYHGATRIVIVGGEGYRHPHDYFDNDAKRNEKLLKYARQFIVGPKIWLAMDYMASNPSNTGHIQHTMYRLLAEHPAVSFIFYGVPIFELTHPRVHYR